MPTTAITAATDLSGKLRYLEAFNFTENAGSPAEARVLLRDGSSGGTILRDIRIPASGSTSITFDKPLYFPSGLYVHVSAGTVRGGVTGT